MQLFVYNYICVRSRNFFCNWIMFLLRWVRLIIIRRHMMRVIAQNCLEYLDAFMTSSYSPRSIVHFASFSKESDESVFPNPNLWRFHIFFSKMSWNQLLIINSFANWFHVRIWVILILPTYIWIFLPNQLGKVALCGNFVFFLLLRFYVKSISRILEMQILPF